MLLYYVDQLCSDESDGPEKVVQEHPQALGRSHQGLIIKVSGYLKLVLVVVGHRLALFIACFVTNIPNKMLWREEDNPCYEIEPNPGIPTLH
ncbi:hypothetical protein CSKR_202125, partial [Clonorchis sinensis]